jgi:histidinol-phosphatase (PHP family)
VIVDYHMHLAPDDDALAPALGDGTAALARLDAAAAAGVDEIGVTEHVYRFAAARHLSHHPFWQRQATADLDAYVDLVAGLRDDGLPVRVGIELDWIDGRTADLAALVAGRDLDLVLGSVHFLGPDQLVDHPRYAVWDELPVDEVYRRYFGTLREAALSGLYDVMAHPDLVKVFGHRPAGGPPLGEYEATAEAFADAGVAAEVSTAGLRKDARELYPAQPFLEALARHDVPITLASDAHVPADVGRGLDRAVAAARAAGYTTVTAFRGREPRQEPLG